MINKTQLLDLMNSGRIVERRIEGRGEVWRVDGQACGAAVKALLKAGLASGHYPTGKGYLHLTEAGVARRPHPWAHAGIITYGTRVYNVWSFTHREGYTGYQLTAPEVPADRPPSGHGHYTSLEGLMARFDKGAAFTPDPPA